MNSLKYFSISFSFIGLLLLSIGAVTAKNTINFKNSSQVIPGKVVKLVTKYSTRQDRGRSKSYYPVVSYQVDSKKRTFQSTTGSNPSHYFVGENVEVFYNSSLNKAKINSFMSLWLLPLVLFGIGSIFSTIGAALLYPIIKHKLLVKKLKQRSVRIDARTTSIEINRRIRVNNKNPQVLYCEGEHLGRTLKFKSINIWDKSVDHLKKGDAVSVLLNPKKPSEYIVDLSPLKKKVTRRRPA